MLDNQKIISLVRCLFSLEIFTVLHTYIIVICLEYHIRQSKYKYYIITYKFFQNVIARYIIIQCIIFFKENFDIILNIKDRKLPALFMDQRYRCVGKYVDQTKNFHCLSVRPEIQLTGNKITKIIEICHKALQLEV